MSFSKAAGSETEGKKVVAGFGFGRLWGARGTKTSENENSEKLPVGGFGLSHTDSKPRSYGTLQSTTSASQPLGFSAGFGFGDGKPTMEEKVETHVAPSPKTPTELLEEGMVFEALWEACKLDDWQVAAACLDQEPQVVLKKDEFERNALHIACKHGSALTVKELLRADSTSAAAVDVHGDLPLHIACANGFTDVVKVLLETSTPSSHDAEHAMVR